MKKNDEFTLKEFFGIFASKLWIICIAAVVCCAAMILYSSVIKKDTYTSHATFYVHKDNNIAGSGDINIAQDMGELYKAFIKTETFLEAIIVELPEEYQNGAISVSALRGMISFSQDGKTPLYKISVTSTEAKLAFDVASCIEAITPEIIMDNLPNAFSITPVVSPKYPESTNTKNLARNAIIGFFAGAAISVVFIWIAFAFDVVVRDKSKLTDYFEYKILGEIPCHNVTIKEVKKEEKNVI